RWLKKEGDTIKAGDVIAEIETDKATMEVEAVDEGILGKILVADGQANVKVNEPIAVLVEEGEAVPSGAPATPAPAPAPAPKATPARAGNGALPSGDRVFASPLARRMAKQTGIDLGGLKGTGPNGRIVRADIEAAQTGGAPAAAPAAAPAPTPAAPVAKAPAPVITAPHKLVPHSSMRKVIARRLTEAKSTIPHFYVSMDIEIDALIDLMKQLNAK